MTFYLQKVTKMNQRNFRSKHLKEVYNMQIITVVKEEKILDFILTTRLTE